MVFHHKYLDIGGGGGGGGGGGEEGGVRTLFFLNPVLVVKLLEKVLQLPFKMSLHNSYPQKLIFYMFLL